MEQGWDPEVKKYFRKILSTIAWGLLWLMAVLTTGFYWGLAFHPNLLFAGIFYAGLAGSLYFLIRYYFLTWRK